MACVLSILELLIVLVDGVVSHAAACAFTAGQLQAYAAALKAQAVTFSSST